MTLAKAKAKARIQLVQALVMTILMYLLYKPLLAQVSGYTFTTITPDMQLEQTLAVFTSLYFLLIIESVCSW
jgi:hypothetical protein